MERKKFIKTGAMAMVFAAFGLKNNITASAQINDNTSAKDLSNSIVTFTSKDKDASALGTTATETMENPILKSGSLKDLMSDVSLISKNTKIIQNTIGTTSLTSVASSGTITDALLEVKKLSDQAKTICK